jgi:hypothetical protein
MSIPECRKLRARGLHQITLDFREPDFDLVEP